VELVRFDSLSLYDRLSQHCADQPDKLAAVTGDTRLTFGELARRVDGLISVLLDRGIGPGDRVLWLGQNSHHIFELVVACIRVGAMVCPVNWRQTTDELKFVLADWDPQVVVWQEGQIGDHLAELRDGRDVDDQRNWIPVDGNDGYEALVADGATGHSFARADEPISAGGLALYTAAFSGRPAAALLSEQGLYAQGVTHIPVLESRPDDVNLVVTPLFHVLSWVALLPVFISGGINVFIPRPNAEEICRAIAEVGATTGPLMPQTAMQVAEFNADGRYDLSGFRSALRVRGWRDMTTPGTTVGGYGQTETTGPILLAAADSKIGGPIRGRPSPIARVRVVDEHGDDVARGEVGEIVVAGPTVTTGFWNRPELTAERLRGDWWNTGDLGRCDEDGVYTFIGPNRRMIKTGGENVYPAEVESCLEAHADVKSAALIGLPDKTWGQLVTAIVERKPGSSLDAPALIADAQTKLAKYKAPRAVHFVDEMPMTAGGKDYAALDAQFGGGNYPGSH